MILVDTGPLVALIHEDDEHHEVCKKTFAAMSEPLGTVWPRADGGDVPSRLLAPGANCPLGNG